MKMTLSFQRYLWLKPQKHKPQNHFGGNKESVTNNRSNNHICRLWINKSSAVVFAKNVEVAWIKN